MKTDSIWYCLFKSFPGIFFELIGQPAAVAQSYEFASVEVKQTAFRIDGVFLPNQPNDPLYFSEFQFQPDPKLYSRFFTEIFLYLDKTELVNNWQGAIVWGSRKLDTGGTDRYWELLESQRVRRIYLDELEVTEGSIGLGLVKLIVEPPPNAGQRAKTLIRSTRTQITDEAIQREILQLIETIIIYKFPKLSREAIEQMLELAELKQTQVYQEAKEEGKLEGLVEGKLEGLVEGKLKGVPRFLELGLSLEEIAQTLELDLETVRQAVQPD
ncbi:Rpn family recombination-promoting nuclease/putative transposase [Phormidesmis sp. 146-12]